jgi:excisionase family DNA binding protein
MTTALSEPAAISLEQAARLLGVTKRTTQRYAASGELPTVKIGGRRFVPMHRFQALLNGEHAKELV